MFLAPHRNELQDKIVALWFACRVGLTSRGGMKSSRQFVAYCQHPHSHHNPSINIATRINTIESRPSTALLDRPKPGYHDGPARIVPVPRIVHASRPRQLEPHHPTTTPWQPSRIGQRSRVSPAGSQDLGEHNRCPSTKAFPSAGRTAWSL